MSLDQRMLRDIHAFGMQKGLSKRLIEEFEEAVLEELEYTPWSHINLDEVYDEWCGAANEPLD